MKDSHRSIFRDDAIRRYAQGKEQAILPRLVSPQTFTYLWFLLGLLTLSSIIAWFTKVPVYTTGSAVVVRLNDPLNDNTHRRDEKIAVVAFFPPQYLSKVQTTKKMFLSFDAMGAPNGESSATRLSRSIITVEPKIISPDIIQKQFALNAQVATQPSVVAIAQLEPIPNNLPASTYLGSVGHAKVEVGSQRLVSLLPLIGQFFEH